MIRNIWRLWISSYRIVITLSSQHRMKDRRPVKYEQLKNPDYIARGQGFIIESDGHFTLRHVNTFYAPSGGSVRHEDQQRANIFCSLLFFDRGSSHCSSWFFHRQFVSEANLKLSICSKLILNLSLWFVKKTAAMEHFKPASLIPRGIFQKLRQGEIFLKDYEVSHLFSVIWYQSKWFLFIQKVHISCNTSEPLAKHLSFSFVRGNWKLNLLVGVSLDISI